MVKATIAGPGAHGRGKYPSCWASTRPVPNWSVRDRCWVRPTLSHGVVSAFDVAPAAPTPTHRPQGVVRGEWVARQPPEDSSRAGTAGRVVVGAGDLQRAAEAVVGFTRLGDQVVGVDEDHHLPQPRGHLVRHQALQGAAGLGPRRQGLDPIPTQAVTITGAAVGQQLDLVGVGRGHHRAPIFRVVGDPNFTSGPGAAGDARQGAAQIDGAAGRRAVTSAEANAKALAAEAFVGGQADRHGAGGGAIPRSVAGQLAPAAAAAARSRGRDPTQAAPIDATLHLTGGGPRKSGACAGIPRGHGGGRVGQRHG
jgi:hypothetical protein